MGVAFQTITGIDSSCMSDRESYDFVRALPPALRKEPAVWTAVPTWDAISSRPVAPRPDAVNAAITLTGARNETEHAALALRNTLVSAPRDVRVALTDFRDAQGRVVESIEASLGIMGVIPSLNFGSTLVPILYPDNMPGDSLLRKYLFNADTVIHFPDVKLPPSGSAVLWLSVTTNHTPPGVYTASVSVQGGQAVPVTVEVLDVTLPGGPFALIGTYSKNVTGMFPFAYADRQSRDIDRALDCGISEWGINEHTDPNHVRMLQSKAAERDMTLMFKFNHAVPSIFVHNTYCHVWKQASDIDDEHRKKLADHVRHIVAVTQAMGLDYDDWYGTLGDEPGESTCRVYAELCRLVKQVDPQVNLYVNPCFWYGWDRGGVLPDPNVMAALSPDDWYRRYVDVSMPIFLLLNDHPQSMAMFSAPRDVNSYYYVSTHLCRSERRAEVTLARRMAWDSLALGFNGWSFYSYYSPRASAWNHFDRNPRGEGLREPSDYQMNYPGPGGIIVTRHSEALRQGWEDWRLLNLLKDQGRQSVVDGLLRDYYRGVPTEILHDRALRAAAQRLDP